MMNTPIEWSRGRCQGSLKKKQQQPGHSAAWQQRAKFLHSWPFCRIKHLLNVLRSQAEPISGEKHSPWSACPRPVSARLLMTAAHFHLPPSCSRDCLSLFQGWGCGELQRQYKKPTWLTHVVYKGIHAGVGVRRWTSLFVCFVSNLW